MSYVHVHAHRWPRCASHSWTVGQSPGTVAVAVVLSGDGDGSPPATGIVVVVPPGDGDGDGDGDGSPPVAGIVVVVPCTR